MRYFKLPTARRPVKARGAHISPSGPRFHSHSGSRHLIGSAATGAISPSEPHSEPPKKYGRDYAHSRAARRQWWTWVDGRVQQALLCNEWEECQPCLSGRHASCRSPGPSLVGLWPLAATARPMYLRLTGAAKWAEWYKRSKAAPCRQPSKSLPVADITIYPPAAQQQFESMARVPVLTASSPQPAEGMARSPLRVVRVVLPFDHTAEPPPPRDGSGAHPRPGRLGPGHAAGFSGVNAPASV